MTVNTRQKRYDIITTEESNNKYDNHRCTSPSKRVSVGNCKYRRVCVENIEIIDRGRNQIFSPLAIKHRLRSASKKYI
jgi:hypothetical protein